MQPSKDRIPGKNLGLKPSDTHQLNDTYYLVTVFIQQPRYDARDQDTVIAMQVSVVRWDSW